MDKTIDEIVNDSIKLRAVTTHHLNYTVEDLEDWLVAKHITTWVNWDLTDPKERRQAAEWMYNQMKDFLRFRGLELK